MSRTRVLVADDEPTFREVLADLVRSDGSLHLVGLARDAEEAVEFAMVHQPDLSLLDVKRPAGGGPRAAHEIRTRSPHTRVLALSAFEGRGAAFQMLRADARGYLVKEGGVEELLAAGQGAVRGQGVLSAGVAAEVTHQLGGQLVSEEAEGARIACVQRVHGEGRTRSSSRSRSWEPATPWKLRPVALLPRARGREGNERCEREKVGAVR